MIDFILIDNYVNIFDMTYAIILTFNMSLKNN